MRRQIKFSVEEVNKIVGQYVLDKKLLGNVESVTMTFHFGYKDGEAYLLVEEDRLL